MKSIFKGLICLLCCATLCVAAEKAAPKKQQGKPSAKKKAPPKKTDSKKVPAKKKTPPKKKKYVPKDVHAELLQDALNGPMKGVEEIIFANRGTYEDGHWYANIGYWCDDEQKKMYPGGGKEPDVGRLCKLNLKTKKLTVLLDAKGGTIRDPHMHYDAKKLIFAWRKANTDYFHLHEINVDGSGLKQLTFGEYNDYEPCYMPDGGIVFISTRCDRWVNCWHTQVGILYRCDGDGDNIRQISANVEHDNTPAILPDGRILHQRWEYVDRSQVTYHHLWTMNPDGTAQMVYYGNQRAGSLYISAKPVPGSGKVLGTDAPGHGRRDHYGYITLFSDKYGPDDERGVVRIPHKSMYCDPYPFSEDCFLAASQNDIVLMNSKAEIEVIHHSDRKCYEPIPVMKRERERVILPRTDLSKNTGHLILTDVYNSRNMGGVERGEIKKLLILESLPKPVNFSGGPDLTSWLGTFTLERVLGTVPVEEDGSASFILPANRAVFFVALDENDMSVKRMQSFVSVAPGEVTSCVGCHENRTKTPSSPRSGSLMAMKRPASEIQAFEGYPDVLDYVRDVQPILDTHCVKCHNYKDYKGRLSLEHGLGRSWSLSFYQMFARLQVADGRNGFGNQPPRTLGTSASRLMQKIDGSHHKATLSEKEWRTVWLWIESAAPYAGTYGALRAPEQLRLHGQGTGVAFSKSKNVMKQRCDSCHTGKSGRKLFLSFDRKDNRGITRPLANHERKVIENDPLAYYSGMVLMNFTKPERSPILLAPLAKEAGGWGSCGEVFADKSDPGYQKMLAGIREGKTIMDAGPRYTQDGFKPNRQYVREMKKLGILPPSFDLAKDEINVFETDQEYWESLWYKPTN
ncbi:MAG: hypothetical protein K9M45_06400 [Kiritimatiellales bacterium]|nr:hypothetical protein [Kiritimatiellales bacterium]